MASLCLTACFCAFLSLTLLTLSRYIYLCHNHIYDKIFTRVSCIIICVISWVVAFLFEFPNFIGWGGHYFDQKNHQCIWDRTASLSYTMFVSIGLIGGPLLVMAICYFLIFQEIWKTKRDIYKLDSENPNRMRKAWNETVRSSKTLFCIFVVFLICWTPYAVTVTLDMQNNFSTEIHLFITLLAHFHSSVNCIIYTTGNKRFRMGILRCFGCTSSQKSFCSNPDVISKKNHSGSSNTPSLNSDSSSPQITKSSSLSTISVSVTSSPPWRNEYNMSLCEFGTTYPVIFLSELISYTINCFDFISIWNPVRVIVLFVLWTKILLLCLQSILVSYTIYCFM